MISFWTLQNSSCNNKDSNTSIIMDNHSKSLVILSAVWLGLCATLVHKDVKLIAVFFAFLASFGLAALLTARKWLYATIYSKETPSPSSSLSSNPTTAAAKSRTRNLVGLVACSTAFWFLSGSSSSTTTTTASTRAEYSALSIAAGYLAFDHWFSALFGQPPRKASLVVIEDASTLIVFLIVLAAKADSLGDYRTAICAWITYKTARLALELDDGGESQPTVTATTVTTTLTPNPSATTPQPLLSSLTFASNKMSSSDKIMSSAGGINADSTKQPSSTQMWTIHGVMYDLHDYVDRHPGGLEAISLGRGRDCTALFESYHPFTEQHRSVLQKYRAKDNTASNTITQRDYFYDILCQRVAKTLTAKGIHPVMDRGATPLRASYYAVVLAALIASGISHIRGSTVGSFLFAVFGWLIGALGHDAGHFAASRSAPLNDWGVWGMSLLCNPILWQHQHTYGHHSYTNEFDHDPDLHHFDTLLRCHRRIQQQSLYKYQSNCVYVTLAYTMVVFGTCFWIPLGMIQEGSLYGLVEWTDRKRPWRTFGLYAHLITYVGLIMVVPFWTHASRWGAVGAASLHIATSGLIFAIFSQINHLNEPSLDTKERERLKQSRDPRLAASWAVNQVETANNFASGSTLWHILSNGLNYQIEHHLFPGVNHCHLHHIAPTVRATCEEFGVCYKSYESWNDTMQATLDWLDKLSVEPELVATEKKAVAVVASKQQ